MIGAIAAGNRRAMQALYARYSVRIYRFVLRLTNDSSLAEDLVSEVFLDVWRGAEGFKAKSQVSTWMLAIARHKALSALRRRSDEQLDEDAATAIADPADDAETTVDKRDRSAIVQHCLLQLSTLHREVLDLVYYHEKSVDEVAEIVGAPPQHREDADVLRAQAHANHARGRRLGRALIRPRWPTIRADRSSVAWRQPSAIEI